jgi:hypothetical protein
MPRVLPPERERCIGLQQTVAVPNLFTLGGQFSAGVNKDSAKSLAGDRARVTFAPWANRPEYLHRLVFALGRIPQKAQRIERAPVRLTARRFGRTVLASEKGCLIFLSLDKMNHSIIARRAPQRETMKAVAKAADVSAITVSTLLMAAFTQCASRP